MPSKKVVLSGVSYWARVYEGSHDEYGGKEFYKITVALDGDSWGKFSKSGMTLQSRPVEKDSDVKGITFRRDVEGRDFVDKRTGKSKTLGGGTPRVVGPDGAVFSELIGNGSEVEVLVEVYQTNSKPPKTGHRLEAVKVTKHVPYDEFREDDDDVRADTDNSGGSFVGMDSLEPVKKTKKDLPF